MLNTKEYLNQLDAAVAIKELDNETAAAIQGGAIAKLRLYDEDNYTQLLGSFNYGSKKRLNADNKIESIKVTDGQWRLYDLPDHNEKGYAKTFGPGNHVLPSQLFNKVSSFQKVG